MITRHTMGPPTTALLYKQCSFTPEALKMGSMPNSSASSGEFSTCKSLSPPQAHGVRNSVFEQGQALHQLCYFGHEPGQRDLRLSLLSRFLQSPAKLLRASFPPPGLESEDAQVSEVLALISDIASSLFLLSRKSTLSP